MNYLKTHIVYVVIILIGMIAVHSYLSEHDARLLAEQQQKISEQRVKDLQQSTDDLRTQIAISDAQAARTIAALKSAAAKVTTPQQAVTEIPNVSSLHPTISVSDPTKVEVPAVEFYQELNQCKQDNISLTACQVARAADEKIIANDQEIVKQKDTEIAAYKKTKTFWARVKGTAKAVGIGVVIGVIVAGHIP